MDFLGIGPLELGLILVLAILILGPRELVRVTRTLGVWIRRLAMSDAWQAMRRATQEVRTLPDRLARESGLDEIKRDLSQPPRAEKPVSGSTPEGISPAWTNPAGENKPAGESKPASDTKPAPAPPEPPAKPEGKSE